MERKFSTSFSHLFHQSSKDPAKGHPPIPWDSSLWPEEWKKIEFKKYPRFRKIALSNSRGISDANLFSIIANRSSQRDFTGGSITKNELSTILKYSCGETTKVDERFRRAQPSGGGLFPIETYVLVPEHIEDIKNGIYHYDVQDNQLDVLWERPFSKEFLDTLFRYLWVKNAAVVFIMTAVFKRVQKKYGERGYRLVLLESGHIGQNIYLASGALGIKCCALAGTNDENIEKLLDIDGIQESVVYAVALGK